MASRGVQIASALVLGALLGLLLSTEHVLASATVMKEIAKGFSKHFEECKNELNLKDDAINEMYNFWNDNFTLAHRDVGCAIICMAQKHGLLTEDGKMHHGSGADFAKKHGADESMATKLVEVIHKCEGTHAAVADECERVLEISKCFRAASKEMNWMPDFQELMDEIVDDYRRHHSE